jgi:hypothetical protein
MKIDHPIAERTFRLFRRDGTSLPVTVRLGAPFVGKAPKPLAQPEYRCAIQILGIGDERVTAPWGEDPFAALQYAAERKSANPISFRQRQEMDLALSTLLMK